MYFDDYQIENICRDNNRYVNVVTSLASINIEDEETILTITNLSRPSHAYIVTNFIDEHYFFATYLDACDWYRDVFSYLNDGIVPIDFDHNIRIRIKKLATT